MQSKTLELYASWLATATAEQVAHVDAILALCEEHYSAGGDTIVECYDPATILAEFDSLDAVRERCLLHVEQELNARWGEDTDAELARYKAAREWTIDEDRVIPLDAIRPGGA